MKHHLDRPKEIVAALLQQARGPCQSPAQTEVDVEPLSGGNTAEVVGLATVTQRWVVKAANDPKVVQEARVLQSFVADERLPAELRRAMVRVVAIQDDPPSYLMELLPAGDGWRSLQDRSFPADRQAPDTPTDLHRGVDRILDVLYGGYKAAADRRLMPSLFEDGVERIAERMSAAGKADGRFDPGKPLTVQGKPLMPLAAMLESMQVRRATLGTWLAPFVTRVHGDSNAGNLILKLDSTGVELKLIDVKAWESGGDWVFDMAKLVHHLIVTLPIEQPRPGTPAPWIVCTEREGTVVIDHGFHVPPDIEALATHVIDRSAAFAQAMGDAHWRQRFELYMASCLLGLPFGRLSSSRRPNANAALMLYAEGMRWLQRVVDRLPADGPPPAALAAATPSSQKLMPPAPLAEARATVMSLAPQAVQALDRRGFELIQWQPPRPNSRGKPAEISLEYEARLATQDESGLASLRAALAVSDGRNVGDALLPRDARIGDLRVHRLPRAPGAQSVDHYYEARGGRPQRLLIPRMLSLRARVAARGSFMTWASTEDPAQRPLNLELPFAVVEAGAGVIARNEFNWIDDPDAAIADWLVH